MSSSGSLSEDSETESLVYLAGAMTIVIRFP